MASEVAARQLLTIADELDATPGEAKRFFAAAGLHEFNNLLGVVLGRLDLLDETELLLMLCDVMLPGGSLGPDVVAQARAFRPGLRVVFMSGYAGEAATHPGRFDARDPLLPKPLSRAELVATLQEVQRGAPAPDQGRQQS